MATTSSRAALHELVDELPAEILAEAVLYVQALRDGDRLALRLLSAPWDDEEETEEERAAIQEADEAIARGGSSFYSDEPRTIRQMQRNEHDSPQGFVRRTRFASSRRQERQ